MHSKAVAPLPESPICDPKPASPKTSDPDRTSPLRQGAEQEQGWWEVSGYPWSPTLSVSRRSFRVLRGVPRRANSS